MEDLPQQGFIICTMLPYRILSACLLEFDDESMTWQVPSVIEIMGQLSGARKRCLHHEYYISLLEELLLPALGRQ